MGKKDFSQTLGQGLLNEVAKKTNSMIDTQNIIALPIEQIHENPDNRKIFSMDNIERLADTIDDEGFWGAIEVIKISDDYYEISSGHRRYAAMKKLGKKNIPCIIIPNMSDEEKAKRLLSSNINNRVLTPLIYGRMIDYYRKEVLEKNNKAPKGGWRKEAAKFFGVSETQIYRFTKLSDLIPELQQLAEIPQFPWTRLENAASLPPEIQKEIYEKIEEDHAEHPEDDYNAARVRQIIDWVREKHMKTNKPKKVDNQEPLSANQNILPKKSTAEESFGEEPEENDKTSAQMSDISIVDKTFASENKQPFGDDYSTVAIEEVIPVMNPPELSGEETSTTSDTKTYSTVPSEVYIENSITQLKLSIDADLSNKEAITAKLNELEQLIEIIHNSL